MPPTAPVTTRALRGPNYLLLGWGWIRLEIPVLLSCTKKQEWWHGSVIRATEEVRQRTGSRATQTVLKKR